MNIFNILLYIILPLAAAVYLFLKRKFSYFERKGIPHVKPSMPMGNMEGLGKKFHFVHLMQKVYDKCKGQDVVVGLYNMIIPTLLVTDLELIKSITVKDFNSFTDRGIPVNEDEPITAHLFAIGGEKWRFLRNKFSPVFTSGKIKFMYNTISSKGDSFVEAIDKASSRGSVEMKEISTRFTIDVISSCAFGVESNTLKEEQSEVLKIFKQIFAGEGRGIQFFFFFLLNFPKLAKLLKIRQLSKSVTDFFYDVVGGTIKYREANNVNRNDFLNMLIQLKNKGSIDGEISSETRRLTMDECIAQAFVFFLAGADTSSTVIAYAITELGHHPEIQDKLRDEITEKVKSCNGEITYESLHEMTYLSQVVNGKCEITQC